MKCEIRRGRTAGERTRRGWSCYTWGRRKRRSCPVVGGEQGENLMGKSLCKWKKADYSAEFKKLAKIVGKPKFVCKKCGRAAADEKFLCDPAPLK